MYTYIHTPIVYYGKLYNNRKSHQGSEGLCGANTDFHDVTDLTPWEYAVYRVQNLPKGAYFSLKSVFVGIVQPLWM